MTSKIFSLTLLLIFSPLLICVSIIILIDDGFPIIFKQKRIGLNNSHFNIYKFRTMKNNVGDIPTHILSKDENLYTLIGPILRKFSLDEFPQLINILKGDMVFIGPRPALYNQDDLIKLRTINGVHKLKPGITGWAQINGRDDLQIKEKVEKDTFYLKNKSTFLNIKIIFLTLYKVVLFKGVKNID